MCLSSDDASNGSKALSKARGIYHATGAKLCFPAERELKTGWQLLCLASKKDDYGYLLTKN